MPFFLIDIAGDILANATENEEKVEALNLVNIANDINMIVTIIDFVDMYIHISTKYYSYHDFKYLIILLIINLLILRV